MDELAHAHDEHAQLGRLLVDLQKLNAEVTKSITPVSDYLVVDRSNRNYTQRYAVRSGVLPGQQAMIFVYENDE